MSTLTDLKYLKQVVETALRELAKALQCNE